ncbi:hypothetical protein, partial [Synechococcus sp.]
MNNLSDIFNDLFSDAFRVSVLIQIVTLGFALIFWVVLSKLLNLEARHWPLERRYKYISAFKELVNELLLLFVLRIFSLALDSITSVAGLAFFVTGFYGLFLFSRFLIILLKFHAPLAIVSEFDLSVLRPAYVIVGFLSVLSQISDLPSLLASPMVMIGGDNFSFNDVLLLLLGSYFLATGTALPAWVLTWLAANLFQLSKPALRATELIIRYLIVAIGLISILVIVGVNYTFLAAIGGGLSV